MKTNRSKANGNNPTGHDERKEGPKDLATVPHWKRPQQVGDQFTELAREGIASLYEVLNAFVEEQYPPARAIRNVRTPGNWGGLVHEHRDIVKGWAQQAGTSQVDYGRTYRHIMRHMEEQAKNRGPREPEVINVGKAQFTVEAGTEAVKVVQVANRWVEQYANELRQLLGDEPGPEHIAELNELVRLVKGHRFGRYGGAAAVKRLKSEGRGDTAAWGAFEKIRKAVVKRLDGIADEYAPVEELATAAMGEGAAPGANGERLQWKGSTIEFVTLFKRMLERGYFDLPSTGGKVGEGNTAELLRRLQRAFIVCKEGGEELAMASLAERWRGTPMAAERAQQFDFPEATRKRPSP